MKSEHNRGHDWPISYEDVRPFYDKVADDIGVSGDAKAEEKWRPPGKPYPMPPMKTFPAGEVWLKGAEANGIRLIPMANGMNSIPFKGRDACIYDGWCACRLSDRRARQSDGDAISARREKPAPKCARLSNVTRVLTNPEGTRAIGVEYYDAQERAPGAGGERRRAGRVVGAKSAYPAQLGDRQASEGPCQFQNELVGKFMMTHHIAGTWALFDEDITPHMGTVGAQFMSYDRYAKTSYPGAFGSSFIAAGTSHKTNDYAQARGDLFGAELAAYMKRAARGLTHMTIFGEDLPHARKSHRAHQRQGRVRAADGAADSQLRRRCGGAVEREFRPGHEDRQGHRRQRILARQGAGDADKPSARRRHHGHRTRRTR